MLPRVDICSLLLRVQKRIDGHWSLGGPHSCYICAVLSLNSSKKKRGYSSEIERGAWRKTRGSTSTRQKQIHTKAAD